MQRRGGQEGFLSGSAGRVASRARWVEPSAGEPTETKCAPPGRGRRATSRHADRAFVAPPIMVATKIKGSTRQRLLNKSIEGVPQRKRTETCSTFEGDEPVGGGGLNNWGKSEPVARTLVQLRGQNVGRQNARRSGRRAAVEQIQADTKANHPPHTSKHEISESA